MTAPSRAHRVPAVCPSCPKYPNTAPIAGARILAGCVIGAALQGVGVRGQTGRSQSALQLQTSMTSGICAVQSVHNRLKH